MDASQIRERADFPPKNPSGGGNFLGMIVPDFTRYRNGDSGISRNERLDFFQKPQRELKARFRPAEESFGRFESGIFGKVVSSFANVREVRDEEDSVGVRRTFPKLPIRSFIGNRTASEQLRVRNAGKQVGLKEFDPYAEGLGIFSREGERAGIGVHRNSSDIRTVPRDCRSNDSGPRSHVDDRGEISGPEDVQSFPNEGFGFETGDERPFIGTERQIEKLDPPGTVRVRTGRIF